MTSERTSERSLTFGIEGGHARTARFAVVALPRRQLPSVRLRTIDGSHVRGRRIENRIEFEIPANGEVSLHW